MSVILMGAQVGCFEAPRLPRATSSGLGGGGAPVITVDPTGPSIPNWTPLGAIVATITVTMSDSSPFTGTLTFGTPHFDDGGIYAISATSDPAVFYLIVNPTGPGVGPEGGNVDQVTVVATQ